jgi:excisionase family DNA binding protein
MLMKPYLVGIMEAARLLGVGRSSVYKRIKLGELERRHIGGRALITRKSIKAARDGNSTGEAK